MRTTGLTKDEQIAYARLFWEYFISLGGLPGEITDAFLKTTFESLVNSGVDDVGDESTFQFLRFMFSESEGMITVMGLTQWLDCGMPQIEMGHKFAAALLTSDVTPDALAMVQMPWRSFFIEVPDGLLPLFDNNSQTSVPIRRILVTKLSAHPHGKWAYVAYSSAAVTMWRLGVEPPELLPPTLEGNLSSEMLLEQTDEDRRVGSLLGRLIINTCLTVSVAGILREKRGPAHELWKKTKANPRKLTGPRSFQLSHPVVIDLRDKVAGFIRGERSKAEVRTLVRGHFKRQHYGAGNLQTKIIWREPFWRGDEALPMVAPRPHVIKAE